MNNYTAGEELKSGDAVYLKDGKLYKCIQPSSPIANLDMQGTQHVTWNFTFSRWQMFKLKLWLWWRSGGRIY